MTPTEADELNVALVAGYRFADLLAAAHAEALDEIRRVTDPLWWAGADPHAIGRVYAKARAWREHSSEAAAAEELIRSELQARYGIDVERVGGHPQLVQNQFERYQLERMRTRIRSIRSTSTFDA